MKRRKVSWWLAGIGMVVVLVISAFWAWTRPSPIVIPPRHYPPNNAYDSYKALAARMQQDLKGDRRLSEIERMLHDERSRHELSPADKAYYRQKMQPYLEAYRQFLDQPCVAVYEYDLGWLFPEMVSFRQLARAEAFEIRDALERRQPREAVERVAAQLRFAEQIRNEGTLLHYLMGNAMINLVLTPLREHLNALEDPTALQMVLDMARRYERERNPLREAVQAEYYFGLSVYRDLRTGKIAVRDLATWNGVPSTLEGRLYQVGIGKPLFLSASLREYHTLLARTGAELEKPMWERKITPVQPRRYLNQILNYKIDHASEQELIEVALVRATGCVAAIKLYKQRTGRYPESLSALNLGDLAIDPFTGKPFIYRLDPKRGFQLYSVGTNRLDEGGRAGKTDREGDLVPLRLPPSQRLKAPGIHRQPVWLR